MAENNDEFWVNDLRSDSSDWWRAVGVASLEEALSWRDRGFGLPAAVKDWKDHKIEDPAEADSWVKAGCPTPQLACIWKYSGLSAEEARPWLASGIYSPSDAVAWMNQYIEPEAAGLLKVLGIDPSSASSWVLDTWDEPHPEVIREFFRRGITDPIDAFNWLMYEDNWTTTSPAFDWIDMQFDMSTARDWLLAGFDASTAHRWIDLGVTAPEQAARYRADGYTPDAPPVLGRRAAITHSRKKQSA